MDSISDSVLGRLTWDEEVVSWNTEVELPDGSHCELSVLDEDRKGRRVVELAHPYFVALLTNYWALRQYIVEELGELAISSWSADPMVMKKTMNSLKIEGINIVPGLQAEVYFEDGDLFGGHTIMVCTDEEGRKMDVTLEG